MSTAVPFLATSLDTIIDAIPGGIKLGYCQGETIVPATGALTAIGEPTSGGYERVPIPTGALSSATREGSTSSVAKTTSTLIEFPKATHAQGTFTHMLVAAGTSGEILMIMPLAEERMTIEVNDTPVVNVQGLKLILGS